ncbi:MAG: ComEC/Rec2 family competence protein [Methanocorpusculum sp.]|nr:ComEC/Rec2 family competence protein [Methanocorpusculum sp.]
MAKKRSSKKSRQNQQKLIGIILGLIVLAGAAFFGVETGVIGGGNSASSLVPLVSDEHAFSMHVIDIGQGDAILLSKDGKYALVDAGETMSPSERESRDAIYAYLDSLNVTTLDFMLLTHQDYDHIGSAKDVLTKYTVKTVYDNGVEHTSATYEKLMAYILEKDIGYEVVRAGDTVASPWDGVKIDVLSPPQELIMSGKNPDINENSIVLKITYGNVTYILTGDAEKDAEEYILSTGANIDADILKSGHHASVTSSTQGFLNKVTPDVIVISVGAGNSYGHPHLETISRYAKITQNVYRTDTDGDVVVTTDGNKYSVVTRKTHDISKIFIAGNGEKVAA